MKTRARRTTGAQVEQVQTIWLSMASSILTYNLFHVQAWSCTNVHDLILYYLSVLKGSVHDCILHGCSSVCDCTECGCSVCIILDRMHYPQIFKTGLNMSKNLTALYVNTNVHNYSVLACSVCIVQDRNDYIRNYCSTVIYLTAVL